MEYSTHESFILVGDAIEWVSLCFLGLLFVEVVYDYFFRQKRSYRETISNLIAGFGSDLVGKLIANFVSAIGLIFFFRFAFWKIELSVQSWLGAVVAADFLYYWEHRFEHRVRLLWAYHSTHHSSADFDLSTAYRLNWLEGFTSWIFFVPMVLVGFNPIQTFLSFVIVVEYQTWIHNKKIGRIRFLEGMLNTPSAHRVHHGSNSRYRDKNYGGVLMVWDRLFGTYTTEKEDVIYGLSKNIETRNPLLIQIHEFRAIWSDLRKNQSVLQTVDCLVRPPGWQSNGIKKGIPRGLPRSSQK